MRTKLLNGILGLAAFIALFVGSMSGDYSLYMLIFLAMALLQGPGLSSVLSLCVTDCSDVDDVGDNTDCKARGGIKSIYYEKYDFFDWAAVEADIALGNTNYFDPALQCFTAVPPLVSGGSLLSKMTFDRKNAFYTFTWTEENDVYEQLIQINFEGKSKANRNAFVKLVNCCELLAIVFDNNCQARLVGVEWDGSTFEKQVKTLRPGRHLDQSGQFGQSKAGDEFDFIGESITAPLFWDPTETLLPV